MKRFVLLIIGLTFFTSCDKKKIVEDYLIGLRWEVLEMTYKGQNYEPYLVFSSFSFKKEGKCLIPVPRLNNKFIKDGEELANWSILDVNKIKIESVKEYLNGEFTFCLGKDQKNKVVYITIESKDLYIKAYRLFGKGFNEPLPSICK